jgi:IclR family KDG regulon transcriptional repressor
MTAEVTSDVTAEVTSDVTAEVTSDVAAGVTSDVAAGVTSDVAGTAPPPDRELLNSVRNAARVLRAFSAAGEELGITELSRRLGLGKSTVHRLVSTLAAERLLDRGTAPGRYRLGLGLYERGTTVSEHVDLHQAALPVLTTLRHETGEMVHVAVLDGLEVVYVERLESYHMMPVFRQVGHRLPAHWTSSGKVLLAALPPADLAIRLQDWKPTAVTKRTITDKQRLLAELHQVAQRGWATNIEEGHAGVMSVGAPIRGRDGRVIAAVSVVGDSARMGVMMRRATTLVVQSAAVISRRLGYRPPVSQGRR